MTLIRMVDRDVIVLLRDVDQHRIADRAPTVNQQESLLSKFTAVTQVTF